MVHLVDALGVEQVSTALFAEDGLQRTPADGVFFFFDGDAESAAGYIINVYVVAEKENGIGGVSVQVD